MTARRVSEPALFSVLERLVFALAALAIFPVIVESMMALRFDPASFEYEDSIVTPAIAFVTAKIPLIQESGESIRILTVIAVAVVIFRKTRFEPRLVALGFWWLVGAYLTVNCIFLPRRLAYYLDFVTSWSIDFTEVRAVWRYDEFIAPYAFGLIWICLAGEFSALVRSRELREEMRVAVDEGEVATERVWRRHQLIAAVTGPRASVASVVGRFLAQVIVPCWALCAITNVADAIRQEEHALPVPTFASLATRREEPGLELRFNAQGQLLQDRRVVADPRDNEMQLLDDLLARTTKESGKVLKVFLHVEGEIEFERLIGVIAAAHRAHVELFLAD